MRKSSEKAAETQTALTTAFWELYKEKPITKITVKEITDRAGFYRSTFYFYFTDVYHVLEKVESAILSDWEAMIAEVLEEGRLDTMLELATTFYDRYGEYLSVLLSPAGDPAFLQKIKDTLRPKMYSVFQVSADHTQIDLIFEFSISAVLAFLTGWYRNGRQIPAREAVALIRALVTKGVLPVMLQHAPRPLDQAILSMISAELKSPRP